MKLWKCFKSFKKVETALRTLCNVHRLTVVNSRPLKRIIPVISDADLILTCGGRFPRSILAFHCVVDKQVNTSLILSNTMIYTEVFSFCTDEPVLVVLISKRTGFALKR